MATNTHKTERPRPIFSDLDHDKLTQIAEMAMRRDPFVAESLADELDRAEVVDADKLPPGVIRIGSTVDFTVDGQSQRATIVFPVDADFENGKLSILTPIAAALIGLSENQTIDWRTRDGKVQSVTITRVVNEQAPHLKVA